MASGDELEDLAEEFNRMAARLEESRDELQRRNAELSASRARIVAAGDDARRRIERDLHDGAQQLLVAMAVKLRLARDAVDDNPADSAALLDELRSDIQTTVRELRNLAHGIFPPLLVSGGLAEALPVEAKRAAQPTTVALDGVGRYHADVETTVYFCCPEAMQNAAKHAGERASVHISVREDGGWLRFSVADDGAGFDPAVVPDDTHGFVNMADRLGAIDGTLDVTSAPGRGTTVSGSIPLPRPTGGGASAGSARPC